MPKHFSRVSEGPVMLGRIHCGSLLMELLFFSSSGGLKWFRETTEDEKERRKGQKYASPDRDELGSIGSAPPPQATLQSRPKCSPKGSAVLKSAHGHLLASLS